MVSMSKPETRVRDRKSALPDSLLSHILSFLPTLCAVRTSILSTRWKIMWTSLANLDFDDERDMFNEPTGPFGKDRFTRFVDRVFLYRDSSDIKKLKLKILYPDDFSRIDDWICTAVKRYVEEVKLEFFCDSCEFNGFPLPQSLLMCRTLKVLKLCSGFECIKYPPPPSRCFPYLNFLHIQFSYPDTDSLRILFAGCPMLEEVSIRGYDNFAGVCSVPYLRLN